MAETYLTRETLLKRIKNQTDEEAWEQFVYFYERFIYSIIRKMNVDASESADLSQAVMVKLWEKLPEFDYSKAKGGFRNWLYMLTRNTVLNHFRKNRIYHENLERHGQLQSELNSPEVEKVIQDEWEIHISNLAYERVKKSISQKAVDVFDLWTKGLEIDQIAEKMNLSENTVYVYKKRIRDRIIAEIKNLNELLC